MLKQGEIIQDGPWAGFEVLSTYTRAQAIQDGTLIDITDRSRRRGITIPCAVTAGVWAHITEGLDVDRALDARAIMVRLEDVLACLRGAVVTARRKNTEGEEDRVYFTSRGTELWALISPGDDASPVMTIMLVGED